MQQREKLPMHGWKAWQPSNPHPSTHLQVAPKVKQLALALLEPLVHVAGARVQNLARASHLEAGLEGAAKQPATAGGAG